MNDYEKLTREPGLLILHLLKLDQADGIPSVQKLNLPATA